MEIKHLDAFNSKKELKDYVQTILATIGVCSSLKHKHYNIYCFFRELLQRHPEKERKGVATLIDIRIDIYRMGGYQLRIVKEDKTLDTISWDKCIKQKVEPYSRKLNEAFRSAIDDQINKFHSLHKHDPCAQCGSVNDLSVDHVTHFAKLKYDFLQLHPNTPKELGKNGLQHACFLEADYDYKNVWTAYHKEHADLRILCITCNQKREKWIAPQTLEDSL
jgi:5-methylcytosine-specific restriction endonuclease McrA